MDNHESIIFIVNDQYFMSSKEEPDFKKSSSLSTIDNIKTEITIAYIDALHFNIIPESLFNESKIDTYLSLTTEMLNGITPVTNKIPQLNSILLWTLDGKIKKNLILKSPGITFHHLVELFLNEPIEQNLHPEIKLRIVENTIYILCYKNGKLQIANRFNISGSEDAIYYTLLCAEHSHLNKKKTLVNIKGNYQEKLIDQIKKYFNDDNVYAEIDKSLQSFVL